MWYQTFWSNFFVPNFFVAKFPSETFFTKLFRIQLFYIKLFAPHFLPQFLYRTFCTKLLVRHFLYPKFCTALFVPNVLHDTFCTSIFYRIFCTALFLPHFFVPSFFHHPASIAMGSQLTKFSILGYWISLYIVLYCGAWFTCVLNAKYEALSKIILKYYRFCCNFALFYHINVQDDKNNIAIFLCPWNSSKGYGQE